MEKGARQNNEGDAAHLQVLLVSDAPVGREQQLEPRLSALAAAFSTSLALAARPVTSREKWPAVRRLTGALTGT
jgi:hypothetical protein